MLMYAQMTGVEYQDNGNDPYSKRWSTEVAWQQQVGGGKLETSNAPRELALQLISGRLIYPPGYTQRLKDNQSLLMPQPGFLRRFALDSVAREKIPGFYSIKDKLPSEEELDAWQKIIDPHQAKIEDVLDKLIDEYNELFLYLNHLVGWKGIKLVRGRDLVQYQDKRTKQSKLKPVERAELSTHQTVDFGLMRQGEVFTRDIATQIDPYVFVNPNSLPNLRETTRYRVSPLGEGGRVLVAGKSVLLSEDLGGNGKVRNGVQMLEKSGYNVGFLPNVNKSKQPKEKQNFVDNHIDGHALLVVDGKNEPQLIVAASYALQDTATLSKIIKAGEQAKIAGLELIDDRDFPHLHFNAVQFSDKTVLLNASGQSNSEGKYLPNELEKTILKMLGKPFVHRLATSLQLIPTLGQGSIRCLINVLPTEFLVYAS